MADLAAISTTPLRPSAEVSTSTLEAKAAPSKLALAKQAKQPTQLADAVNTHAFDSFACGHDVATGATACVSGHSSDSVILKGMQLPALAGIRTGIQVGTALATFPGQGTPSITAPPPPQNVPGPVNNVPATAKANITPEQLAKSSSANVQGLLAADQVVATMTVPNDATGKQQVAKFLQQRFGGADFKAAYNDYNKAHPGAHLTPQKFAQGFMELAWQMSAGAVDKGSGQRTVAIPDEAAVIDLAKLSAGSAIEANGGKPITGMNAAQLADAQTTVLRSVEKGVRSDSAINARETSARTKLVANHVGTGSRDADATREALDQDQSTIAHADNVDPMSQGDAAMAAQAADATGRAQAAEQNNRFFRVARMEGNNPAAVANGNMKHSADKMIREAIALNLADAEKDSIRATSHDDSGVAPGTLAGLSFTGRARPV